MSSKISLNAMRVFFWYFNKTMRKNIQGLYVDDRSVKMVKDLISQNHKVILMPLYRTYIDFFVQMFVMSTQRIQLGFTFGNFEDTPRIRLIDAWLKNCGYILSRRKQGQSLQSSFINSQMLKEIIAHNQVTTIYRTSKDSVLENFVGRATLICQSGGCLKHSHNFSKTVGTL